MNQNEDRHIDFEQVARYLSNEMSDAEKSAFENEMVQNSELAQEVANVQSIWNSAENKTVFDAEAAWNKLDQKIKKNNGNGTRSSRKWILRIAASFMILVGFYWWRSAPSSNMIALVAEIQSEYNLPDGSKIIANQGTNLAFVDDFEGDERRVELEGEAFFDVERHENKPFVVHTTLGEIKVLGTEFNVKTTENGQLRVAVQEGKVQVTSNENEQVILTKGQSAYYDVATKNLIKKEESFDLYWINKTLKFKDTNLKMVFEIIEKNYNVSIEISDDAALECTYNGTFNNAPIDTVFHVLQQGFENIRISQNENSYSISGHCN